MVAVETEIGAIKEAAEIERESSREWRESARNERAQILSAVRDHVNDSAKVPGYQGNGGVVVISKKMIGFTLMFVVAVIAAVFAVLEFAVVV
jgi:hypothetical protein